MKNKQANTSRCIIWSAEGEEDIRNSTYTFIFKKCKLLWLAPRHIELSLCLGTSIPCGHQICILAVALSITSLLLAWESSRGWSKSLGRSIQVAGPSEAPGSQILFSSSPTVVPFEPVSRRSFLLCLPFCKYTFPKKLKWIFFKKHKLCFANSYKLTVVGTSNLVKLYW